MFYLSEYIISSQATESQECGGGGGGGLIDNNTKKSSVIGNDIMASNVIDNDTINIAYTKAFKRPVCSKL